MQFEKRNYTLLGLAFTSISILLFAQFALAISSSNVAIYNQWGTVQDCTFLIFKDSITTYAKNCDTGAIDYSGTSSATVIQSAADAITTNPEQFGGVDAAQKYIGGKIIIKKGIYSITSQVWVRPTSAKEVGIEIVGEGRSNTILIVPSGTSLGSNAVLRIGDSSVNPATPINAPVVKDLWIINEGTADKILYIDFATWGKIENVGIWSKGAGASTNYGIYVGGAAGRPTSTFLIQDTHVSNVYSSAGNVGYYLALNTEFVTFMHTIAVTWNTNGYEILSSGPVRMFYPHSMNSITSGIKFTGYGGLDMYSPHIEGGTVTEKAFWIAPLDNGTRTLIESPDVHHLKASTGTAYYMSLSKNDQQIAISNHLRKNAGNAPVLFNGVSNPSATETRLFLMNNDFNSVGSTGTVPASINVTGWGNKNFYVEREGKSFFHFWESRTGNTAVYYAIAGDAPSSSTESSRQITITDDIIITRMKAVVGTNSKDGSTVLAFRDDSSSVATLTIGAGVTGQRDSGVLYTKVAAGSLVNFLSNTTASSTGTFSTGVVTIEYEYGKY